MVWIKPKGYSKSKVDWAGEILKSNKSTEEDITKALTILTEWRAKHNYPLGVFINRLKRVSKEKGKEAFSV